MPFAQTDGARLYWRCDGPDNAPALLLGNSIGTDHALWDPVMPVLMRAFRVIRYDARGHGASDAPAGEYSMERLGLDALAIADAAGAERFHYAGISLGGMVGLWLGENAAKRIDRLALCNTSAYFGPESWAARIAAVRSGGMAAITDMVMARFFTPAYVKQADARFASVRRMFLSIDAGGYIGCGAAIRDMDLRAGLPRIQVPTLVVTGAFDQATPPAQGLAIAQAIPGARYAELACAHIPTHEAGPALAGRLCEFFLDAHQGGEPARYERGLARRKEVLGVEYVEARLRNRHPFTDEFQALITRYAWGELWTRPVFDDRTRRLLVLAMMVALKSWEEFELHVRAGFEHELSQIELKEMLMLAAIYCGVPAANTAFGHARKIIGP
jgi:3-oxoadipate enol-lactonase/4-carboxymuconolactone decarboxylase